MPHKGHCSEQRLAGAAQREPLPLGFQMFITATKQLEFQSLAGSRPAEPLPRSGK